ncbi:flagellar assembly protein FliH [Granulicella rosea]|uniref:Flagellar assembly protein FliH n=1 Tax=Granulicella rosea TaxID=474952 RepID=A0A239ELJ2_9BACT|nr:FliH/SctL family protein [Granulicella rosea]SNS44903.1 flagellar assembly protein FliH [Granulicella rosea]
MISKSDSGVRLFPEMPVDLAGGKPNVSLMEFLSMELPRLEAAAQARPSQAAAAAEAASAAQAAHEEALRQQERAAQTRTMIDAARAEARVEARREMEREVEARLAAERERVATVCADFIRDRQRYFADAEEQVVKLALAIAARVLHRESMMDPLLLAGAVRVAIAKVEDTSAVSLRVVPADEAMWRGVFPPGSEPIIEVQGDERLMPGEVVLETVVGRVELGVAVQLEEIEQGFFDLLQRRPN